MEITKIPNQQQNKIINDLDNNILLFASAGTGKTFTLSKRIENIINGKRCLPQDIVALTFTVKACEEIKNDVKKYVGNIADKVLIKTIHGFCLNLINEYSILNKSNYIEPDVIDDIDEDEKLVEIATNNFNRWRLEDFLTKTKINGLVELFKKDVVYDKNSRCFYWVIENNGNFYLLNFKGEYLNVEKKEIENSYKEIVCPNERCKYIGIKKDNFCPKCGEDFRSYIKETTFEATKRQGFLRTFVSTLKHEREKLELYSNNEIEDYDKTYAHIKQNNKELYDKITKYYSYGKEQTDKNLIIFFDSYCGKFICEYNNYLRLNNFLDYDDLIINANRILKNESVREYFSKKYKYCIVDEMQDTSILEYSVLDKVFYNSNLMMCGDFFQTIYEWRGSSPENILSQFKNKYNTKTYMLNENYRATKILSNASFNYVKNCFPQFVGKFYPANISINSGDSGEKIKVLSFESEFLEAKYIYDYILKNKEEKDSICIMGRTNAFISSLSKALEKIKDTYGKDDRLSFFTFENNLQFLKRPIIKDALSFLRVALNPFDRFSLERISKLYLGGVGNRTIQNLKEYSGIAVDISSFIFESAYTYGDQYFPLIDALQNGRVVVYDTETTGLDLNNDEIIQLCAVKIDITGRVIEKFEKIIKPNVKISEGARETIPFDIDREIENRGVSARNALIDFYYFVSGCVLVGHNSVNFDRPLIERERRDNGVYSFEVANEYDTMNIAKVIYPTLKNYKLSTLCEHLGVVNKEAHNAIGDVLATADCLNKMVKGVLIPTIREREIVTKKYSAKFSSMFKLIGEIKKSIKNNCIEEALEFIFGTIKLENLYTNENYTADKLDLLDILRTDICSNCEQHINEVLKTISLSGSQLDMSVIGENKIPIITVHQSKGLEFNTVIIAGANDNNFPTFIAKKNNNIEEEKRVFYVAIGRAKKKLIITMSENEYNIGESRFISLIPQEYIDRNK